MQNKMANNITTFINNKVDKIITRLGSSNDSEIVTAALAAFKLLFIPLATLSDKKTTKEQKEYALKRDFLTEGIALIGYLGITSQVKKLLTGPICAKYYSKKAKELLKNGILNHNSQDFKNLTSINTKNLANFALSKFKDDADEVIIKNAISPLEEAVKKLNLNIGEKSKQIQLPKELYLNTKKTISHLCVCTLALSIIPFATNKVLELISKTRDSELNIQPWQDSKLNLISGTVFGSHKTKLKKEPTMLKNTDINTYINITRGHNNVIAY